MNDSQPETDSSENNTKNKPDPLAKPTWALVKATYWLAFISLGMTVFTYLLFRETVNMGEITKSGIDSSHKENEKSVALADSSLRKADKSLILAKQSLDLAERNFEIENRAFVSMEGMMELKFEIGEKSNYVITMKNYGHTPAYIKYAVVASQFTDYEKFIRDTKTQKFIDSAISGAKLQSQIISSNGITQISDYTQELTKGIDDAMKSGKTNLYIWGKIVYNDFFGKQHYTSFCGMYNNGTAKGFTAIGKYNDVN